MPRYEKSIVPVSWGERQIYNGLRKKGLRAVQNGIGFSIFSNHGKILAVMVVKRMSYWMSRPQQFMIRTLLAAGIPCYAYTGKNGIRLVVDSKYPIRKYQPLEKAFEKKVFRKSLLLRRPDWAAYTEEQKADAMERQLNEHLTPEGDMA